VSERVLVVNADDFGISEGVNRAVVEAHVSGIVTSASLMVTGAAVRHAVALAREHPRLGVGVHWDLDSSATGIDIDLDDAAAVRAELARQLQEFDALMGRAPDHVDSHHHVHRRPDIGPVARELAAPLGVPLRGESTVAFVGGFYGQWEWGVTELEHISPEFLIWILRNEVGEGWTEIGCHPGYAEGLQSAYLAEREVELATLTDPRVRDEIRTLGIRLANHGDRPRE
jgi:chitin disaccharide deacetylase